MKAVLVGAGHGHLAVVRRARRLRRSGVDLLLIAPRIFRYSGLATGILSGALPAACGEIDIRALAKRHGVEYREAEVAEVDLAKKSLRLDDGQLHPFEIVSLNIGSQVKPLPDDVDRDAVWAVKPLSRLLDLRRSIEAWVARAGASPRIVIAGAGATGLELAGALAGLTRRLGVSPLISVVGHVEGGPGLPLQARARLISDLGARGVAVVEGAVVGRAGAACRLGSGLVLPCDFLVLATGLTAPGLTSRLGLELDGNGRIVTRATLQSVSNTQVFALGDCAVLQGAARPPLGVFGVRAGPVLARNLAALAEGRPLKSYRPQSRWLSILDLGDGTALATWGKLWWSGRLALRLKRWLDLRFIRRARGGAS